MIKNNNCKIELSSKDIIKGLILPAKMSEEIAYLTGVLAGDGNIFVREDKKDYRIKCVGNPKDEKDFYKEVVTPLFKKVFNLGIEIKEQDSGTTFGFYVYSKSLVRYFTEVLELPSGRKYNKLKIPQIVKENNLVTHFMRGLADTDFCVTYKKNGTYPCIIGTSDSKSFMKEIAVELKRLGFKLCEIYDYKLIDSRFKKGYSIINRIELNGKKNLDLWMSLIGFSSPKHLKKIKW
jgi:hypothetical protein